MQVRKKTFPCTVIIPVLHLLHMKRAITSFEPADDVGAMLRRAKSGGIKVGHLCNEALRRYLTEIGLAHKRDPEPRKLTGRKIKG